MRLQDRLKNNLTGNFQTNTSDNNRYPEKNTEFMLVNRKEEVKKAVEQGQIKVTDTEKKIYDAAPEVDVDTSSQDNNYDAAPEVDVDTSSQDFNLGDAGNTLADFANLETPTGPMMFLGENLGDASAQVVSNGFNAGEAVNQVTDTAKKTVDKTVKTVDETVNNVLPGDIGKNLGLALYGILAVAGIGVFVYILSALKPLFEIGSNVSEK